MILRTVVLLHIIGVSLIKANVVYSMKFRGVNGKAFGACITECNVEAIVSIVNTVGTIRTGVIKLSGENIELRINQMIKGLLKSDTHQKSIRFQVTLVSNELENMLMETMDLKLKLKKPQVGTVKYKGLAFTFEVTALCENKYYGKNCETYCVAQNDNHDGFYNCDETTGEKVCLPTYGNPLLNCLMRNFCNPNNCKNGGTCRVRYDQCKCTSIYKGKYCEIRKAPCDIENPCTNRQKCVNKGKKAACICREPFVGKDCSYRIGGCRQDLDCMNGGYCTIIDGVHGCNCTQYYDGLLCDKDVNECLNRTKYCIYKSKCENFDGGYRCSCVSPVHGKNCDKCENDVIDNECGYSFNERWYWPAIAISLSLILYSFLLSAYFWHKAVTSAKHHFEIKRMLTDAATNVKEDDDDEDSYIISEIL